MKTKIFAFILAATSFLFMVSAWAEDMEDDIYLLCQDGYHRQLLLSEIALLDDRDIYLRRPYLAAPASYNTASLVGSRSPLATSGARTQNTQASTTPRSVYYIPDSSASGGVDVNIIDWIPSTNSSVTGYNVYRREFGTSDWTLISDAGNRPRYFDQAIDKDTAYQYQVRPHTAQGELAPIAFNMSTNYMTRESNGLQPENVLILVNVDAPGFVDLSQEVSGHETANGKLDIITEAQLQAFLGYTAGDPNFYNIVDADGTAHNTTWHIIKHADGRIEVPLGVYYAIRREIPKENIVFLNHIPTIEHSALTHEQFIQYVINPIKDHILANGLTQKITSIVSSYHFPLYAECNPDPSSLFVRSWEDSLNYYLWQALGQNVNNLQYRVNNGHHFSRILGDDGFLCTRIDAIDTVTARRMIDDAIWAEMNYFFNDPAWRATSNLKAFIDWYDPRAENINQSFLAAVEVLRQSGLFGDQGQNWDMAANIWYDFIARYDANGDQRLDNTFLYTGWYNYFYYRDFFNWARGAIGWNLDSYSGKSFIDNNYWGGLPWAANILNHGACATLGAVNEPVGIGGHTDPDIFMYYILNGYSFAEAAYYASGTALGGSPGMMAFDGDPLYSPFGRFSDWRVSYVQMAGNTLKRVSLGGICDRGAYVPNGNMQYVPYRDYDQQGRLVRELLESGMSILYLANGSTLFYDGGLRYDFDGGTLARTNNRLWLYDADERLLYTTVIPAGHWHPWWNSAHPGDVKNDEIFLMNGGVFICRHYFERSGTDILDIGGSIFAIDGATGIESRYVLAPHIFSPCTLAGNAALYSYEVLGIASYDIVSGVCPRIASITVPGEFVLSIDYEPGSLTITGGRYYDAAGNLLATIDVDRASGTCRFRNERTGVLTTMNRDIQNSAGGLFELTNGLLGTISVGTPNAHLQYAADLGRNIVAELLGISNAQEVQVTGLDRVGIGYYRVHCLAERYRVAANVHFGQMVSQGNLQTSIVQPSGEEDIALFIDIVTGRDYIKEHNEIGRLLISDFDSCLLTGYRMINYENGTLNLYYAYDGPNGSFFEFDSSFTTAGTTQYIEWWDSTFNVCNQYYITSNYNGPDGLRTTTIDAPLYTIRYSAQGATARASLTSFTVKANGIDLLPAAVSCASRLFNPAAGEGVSFESWAQNGASVSFKYRLRDGSAINVNVNAATGTASIGSSLEQALLAGRDLVARKVSSPQPVQTRVEGIFQYESPGPNDPAYRFTISTAALTFTIDCAVSGGRNTFTMRSVIVNATGDDLMTMAGAARISFGIFRAVLTENGTPNYNPMYDLNGSGVINGVDIQILKNLLGMAGSDMSWVMAVGRVLDQSGHDEPNGKDARTLLSKVKAALGKRGGDDGWNDVSIYDFDFDGDIDQADIDRMTLVTDSLGITPPDDKTCTEPHGEGPLCITNGDQTIADQLELQKKISAQRAALQQQGIGTSSTMVTSSQALNQQQGSQGS